MPRSVSPQRSHRWIPAALVLGLVLALWWTVPAVLREAASDAATPVGGPREAGDVAPSTTPGAAGGPPLPAASPGSARNAQRAVDSELGTVDAAAGAQVVDLASGEQLAGEEPGRAMVPASGNKVFTLLAASQHLDPRQRLATRVVGTGEPGRITVVAGGDTLLSPGRGDPERVSGHAGVDTLAERTADALRREGVTGPVTVGLDTSIFSGPALNPAWDPGDVEAGEITAVSPIAFYSHRVPGPEGTDPGDTGERPRDAGGEVLEVFRDRLAHHLGGDGPVRVREGAPSPGTEETGHELARVESAPLSEQAGLMAGQSDNSLAEVIARLAARAAGEQAGVAGVRETLTAAVRDRGIPAEGLHIVDGSGMSAQARSSPATLAGAVRALALEDGGGSWARTLPVAGSTGTLSERFDDPDEREGRGVARAKTGTLNHVATLSGIVHRRDGSVLVYSLMLGDTRAPAEAKDALDRTVAALAQG